MAELLMVLIALAALVYAVVKTWRALERPRANGPRHRRFLLFVGLFVVIYTAIVVTILVGLVFAGVNFTLITSFLSAPLWIVCIVIARALAKRLSWHMN